MKELKAKQFNKKTGNIRKIIKKNNGDIAAPSLNLFGFIFWFRYKCDNQDFQFSFWNGGDLGGGGLADTQVLASLEVH